MTQAASTTLQSFSTDLATLVATASGSVVGIHGPRSRARGFAWRPGLFVTCEESLAEVGPYELVLPGGTRVGAPLVGRDPTTEVAVLRHEGDNMPLSAIVASDPSTEPRRTWDCVLRLGPLAGDAWRRDRRAHRP